MVLSVIFTIEEFPEILLAGGAQRIKQQALREAAVFYKQKLAEEYQKQGVTNTGALAAATTVKGSRDNIVLIGNEMKYAAAIELGSVTYPKKPPLQPLIAWASQRWGLSGKPLIEAAKALQLSIFREGTLPHPVWELVFSNDNIAKQAAEIIARRLGA